MVILPSANKRWICLHITAILHGMGPYLQCTMSAGQMCPIRTKPTIHCVTGLYSVEDDGYTNTYYKNGRYAWTSDSFGDFIWHYMDAFASVPEWAGSTSNHLLRSGSTIKNINYNSQNITYSTFDTSGTEKLKLTSAPKSVTVDGKPISSYVWNKLTKVLIISRSKGTNVIVVI